MAGKKQTPAATAVTKHEEPAKPVLYDAEDLGAGFEDLGRQDLAIPFFSIIQSNSKQVDEDDGRYIEDAKPGMILNTVSQEVYEGRDKGILFIPVHRTHMFNEWVPLDEGGGFVGAHDPESDLVKAAKSGGQRFGKLESPDGNDLVETFSVFGLRVLEDGSFEYGVVAFSSTQIKHYRRWMTVARGIMIRGGDGSRQVPPMFAHVYRLGTQPESNKKGKWFGWSIKLNGKKAEECRLAQDTELYQAAKAFRDMVTSGVANAAYNSVDAELVEEDEDDEM